MKKYTSAVIGLGQIGQGYDYDIADDTFIKSHATGFLYHDAFELIAGVDPDSFQRERFEKKFQCPAFAEVSSMLLKHKPQVIALSVPTDFHYQLFNEAIVSKPKAIICEKPIAKSVKDALQMFRTAEEKECVLLVNYARRFDPDVINLKGLIQKNEFGKIYKGTVWYSKGLLNNGSHFIDLLIYFFGKVNEIKILNRGRKWDNSDPEPDVFIRFGDTSIYFLAAREESYSLYNVELIGTKGKIRYDEGGAEIEIRYTQPHPVYKGYTVLNPEKRKYKGCLERFQWHVLEHLSRHLMGKSSLSSNGYTATETLKVVEDIFSML